jgi:tetratricopeptide (TPR) repeat protein
VLLGLNELANAYEREATQGDPDWSAGCWNSCRGFRYAADPENKKMPDTYFAYGQECLKEKKFQDAEQGFLGGISWLDTRTNGKDSPQLIVPLRLLAKAQEAQKHFSAAIQSLNRALSISLKSHRQAIEQTEIQSEIARITAKTH